MKTNFIIFTAVVSGFWAILHLRSSAFADKGWQVISLWLGIASRPVTVRDSQRSPSFARDYLFCDSKLTNILQTWQTLQSSLNDFSPTPTQTQVGSVNACVITIVSNH